MHILFLTRLFYPHVGGVEKHVEEIGTRLVAEGHTVTVITEEINTSANQSNAFIATSTEKKNGILIKRIPLHTHGFIKKFVIWYWLFQNRNILKKADIVHCHDVFFWYLPFRFLYPNKKVYITFHGYESYPVKKRAIFVRKISEKLAGGNICIGDFIQKWYHTKPDFVSYGAVTIPETKEKYANSNSAVFIGRLDEQTSIQIYKEAAMLIKKQVPGFEFVIFGDGPYKKYLTDFSVHGFVPNGAEKLPLYRFAFVSRFLSILEAFGQRRLVLAVYDNPIKKDYLLLSPFAPFIVAVDSAQKLSESVIYYLHHKEEEQRRIEHAYEWVKKQTWEHLVGQYKDLWQERE